jgi:hypothetical protein
LIEFVQRQGDLSCWELSKPLLIRPKCVCTGMGLRVCVSPLPGRPSVAVAKRGGAPDSGSFVGPAQMCRGTLGWGTNLRVSVSPLPGRPSVAVAKRGGSPSSGSFVGPAQMCRGTPGWGTNLRVSVSPLPGRTSVAVAKRGGAPASGSSIAGN